MTEPDIQLTSQFYWLIALVTALIDAGLVLLLAWLVKPSRFRELKWSLAAASGIFWACVWTTVLWGFAWELTYRHIFPEFARFVVPPAYGVAYFGIGLACWWLALRMPDHPVVNFCTLGGLISLPGHLWAIYGMDFLDRVPMMRGVSPGSALVFGVFEFVFYFCFILIFALLLRRLWVWSSRRMQGA